MTLLDWYVRSLSRLGSHEVLIVKLVIHLCVVHVKHAQTRTYMDGDLYISYERFITYKDTDEDHGDGPRANV